MGLRHSEFLPAGRQGISESHHADTQITMGTWINPDGYRDRLTNIYFLEFSLFLFGTIHTYQKKAKINGKQKQ